MFGQPFYYQLLQKHIAIFGALFNNVVIERSDGVSDTQRFKVPISFGPREKFLAIVKTKPDEKVQAIQLPRMSFEITGWAADPARKFNRGLKWRTNETDGAAFEPVPYNINIQLNVMVKQTMDGLKIIEQILPYFNPDWTVSAQLLDNSARTWDIPIVLTDTSHQDTYEGSDFIERRALIYTFDFVMKGWLQSPLQTRKLIKFITVNTYGSLNVSDNPLEHITVQPGLTANGEPTNDANNTIDYHLINPDDNWGIIAQVYDG